MKELKQYIQDILEVLRQPEPRRYRRENVQQMFERAKALLDVHDPSLQPVGNSGSPEFSPTTTCHHSICWSCSHAFAEGITVNSGGVCLNCLKNLNIDVSKAEAVLPYVWGECASRVQRTKQIIKHLTPDEGSKVLAAAKLLEGLGVEFHVALGDGNRILDSQNLVTALNDPTGWLAKQYGITPEKMKAWLIWRTEHCQCTGTTRKGNQCRNYAAHEYDRALPNHFVPGESDRCSLHIDVYR